MTTPRWVDITDRVTTLTTTPPITVEAWRTEVLQHAGYPTELAQTLAHCTNVDLHQAVHLLEHGCPPLTALRILL
jgi:hypothetical protein